MFMPNCIKTKTNDLTTQINQRQEKKRKYTHNPMSWRPICQSFQGEDIRFS